MENPLLPTTKSTSNWSGGTQSKMYELPWWVAVISIISDDGSTLSQIIFLSSPVNQYLLQISSLQNINNFSSFIFNIKVNIILGEYLLFRKVTNKESLSLFCRCNLLSTLRALTWFTGCFLLLYTSLLGDSPSCQHFNIKDSSPDRNM